MLSPNLEKTLHRALGFLSLGAWVPVAEVFTHSISPT